jgi:3-hydroxyacyl-CoA dehydrogenase
MAALHPQAVVEVEVTAAEPSAGLTIRPSLGAYGACSGCSRRMRGTGMEPELRTAAVIGAGTMGAGIAALLAEKGMDTFLLDVVPSEVTESERDAGLTLEDPGRNRLAANAIRRLKSARVPPLTDETARRVAVGNIEDNLGWIAEADWVIEAIVEDLGAKQNLLDRIELLRRPDTIVSTNTSGLPVREVSAGRSAAFGRHFLGTHFFNPPHQMKLLEIVPGPVVATDILAFMIEFSEHRLGKGVVVCRDTPSFIANRIAAIQANVDIGHGIAGGYSVEEVDAILGPAIGRPPTAVFRLRDLVGLDVSDRVWRNLYSVIPDDPFARFSPFLTSARSETPCSSGWLGRRGRAYKRVRHKRETNSGPQSENDGISEAVLSGSADLRRQSRSAIWVSGCALWLPKAIALGNLSGAPSSIALPKPPIVSPKSPTI